MIKVHHLEHSRSQRVLWLLEELGVPYELVRYARDERTLLAPAALRAVHPLGKSPVLEDDRRVVAESGAIIEYVLDRHDTAGTLSPSREDEDARLRYRYWLHYAEGSAMPPMVMALVFARIRKAPMPFFARPIARRIADGAMKGFVGPQIAAHLAHMEAALADRPWFAGERFTAADIQMSFPVEAGLSRGKGDYPNLANFLERIHARPAYQRAIERGGPVLVQA